MQLKDEFVQKMGIVLQMAATVTPEMRVKRRVFVFVIRAPSLLMVVGVFDQTGSVVAKIQTVVGAELSWQSFG